MIREPARLRDPGLQPARTGLAWLRSSMVLLGLGALSLRLGIFSDEIYLSCAGFFLLIAAVPAALRGRNRAHYEESDDVTAYRTRLLAGLMTAAIALAALLQVASLVWRIARTIA